MDTSDIETKLTLMLLFLSSWEEGPDLDDAKFKRAWKGYDFDILRSMADQGLIQNQRQPSRVKSVVITKKGEQLAQQLLEKYQQDNNQNNNKD